MKYLKYIIIGLIQGLTEPLPISSSAHMIFINYYFHDGGLTLSSEVFINFASTLAILIFFRHDIKVLITNTFHPVTSNYLNYQYTLKLILASIPCVVIGFLASDLIDQYFMNFFTSSICLLLTSFCLIMAFIFLIKKQSCNETVTFKSALTIGLFQGAALLPGLSRSGLTLTAGLSTGVCLKRTLQFSFFLYLIASFGAIVLTFFKTDFTTLNLPEILISSGVAFVSTSLSIRWFYQKLDAKKILFFSLYALILAIINLIIYFH